MTEQYPIEYPLKVEAVRRLEWCFRSCPARKNWNCVNRCEKFRQVNSPELLAEVFGPKLVPNAPG